MESMYELGLTGKMTVMGLAKNEEELFFPGDMESKKLPYNSEGLKLIRRIRDEVHRFGITFHRQKRSKGTFSNELESIKGIGPSMSAKILDARKTGLESARLCGRDIERRNIDSNRMLCAELAPRSGVATAAAARVDHALVREI